MLDCRLPLDPERPKSRSLELIAGIIKAARKTCTAEAVSEICDDDGVREVAT